MPKSHLDQPLSTRLPPLTDEAKAHTIDQLYISTRAENCLKAAGIRNLGELAQLTPRQLLAMDKLGRKTMKKILEFCNELLTG